MQIQRTVANVTFALVWAAGLAVVWPVFPCGAQTSSLNEIPFAAPTPEEQARQLQEQVLSLLQSRLDAAATLLGRGQNREAVTAYRRALLIEPDFASLATRKADLTARADALQEQIFQVQRQAARLNTPMAADLDTQKIALEGQLRAVQKLLIFQNPFAEAHANLAHLLVQTGAFSESVTQYQQAIHLRPALESTLRPAILHARLLEADRLAKLGSPQSVSASAGEYREVIRLAPGNASAHFGLGHALLTLGKAGEAVSELQEAVRLDPSDTEAALTLGMALYQSGRREQARQQWRRFTGSQDARAAAEAQGMLDRYLLEPPPPSALPKDAKEADIQRGREQVREFPDEAFSHSNLALALYTAKQMDEALSEVQEALRLNPDSVQAHTNLGLILSESEQDDAAEAQYRQALKLDSDNGAVHNNLGVVYFNRQQWKRAEYEFRKALQGDRSDPYAHHNLADTLLQEGRYPESIRECGKTLQYDPKFSAAFGTRGLVEDKLGQSAAGLADLRQAVHLAADPAVALLNLAEPLQQFAGHDLAVQQFRSLQAQYPETAEGDDALGRLQMNAGQEQDAAASFQAAVRRKPDLVSAHLHLARVWLRLNRLAEAAQAARSALRLEPRSGEALNTLGLALYQQGQTADGRRQWEAALPLDDKDAARNAAGFLEEFP